MAGKYAGVTYPAKTKDSSSSRAYSPGTKRNIRPARSKSAALGQITFPAQRRSMGLNKVK